MFRRLNTHKLTDVWSHLKQTSLYVDVISLAQRECLNWRGWRDNFGDKRIKNVLTNCPNFRNNISADGIRDNYLKALLIRCWDIKYLYKAGNTCIRV